MPDREIAELSRVPVVIDQVSNATRHTGSKVSTDMAQHHDATASHVLTAMIANRFDNHIRTAVPHAKGSCVECGL